MTDRLFLALITLAVGVMLTIAAFAALGARTHHEPPARYVDIQEVVRSM